jgi:multiple sugar transport system substrate-binding protein
MINYWAGFTGPDKLGMQRIVEGFKTQNPTMDVDFLTAPWTETFTKFNASFGSASGPNLLVMHISDIPQFADRKMLTEVEALLPGMGIKKEDFPGPVWEGQFYGGKQYGVPLDYHPMSVFKNVTMYKAAGLDPAERFTSADIFLNAMKKLTSGEQYGLAIGVPHGHTIRYWYGLLFQAGGSFLTPDFKKAAFNSAAGIKALKALSDLVHVYKVVPLHETDIDRDFLSGRVASLIEGPWWVPGGIEQKGLEFTTVPFPVVFDKPGVWAGAHTLTIPRQDDKKKEAAAIQLMKYIVANSVDWGAAGQIPASLAVINSQAYKNLPTYKYFLPFIEQSAFVHFEPIIKANAEFGADNQLSPVLNAISGVILGEAKPEAALAQAEADVNRILQK